MVVSVGCISGSRICRNVCSGLVLLMCVVFLSLIGSVWKNIVSMNVVNGMLRVLYMRIRLNMLFVILRELSR